MKAFLSRCLGGVLFEEEEEAFAFRFRFLFVLLLFGALTSGLFLAGHHAVGPSMGRVHSRVQSLHVAVSILSMAILYGRKERFLLVAWFNAIFSLPLFASALLFVPRDELRVLWFFLSLPSVYLLLGRWVGNLFSLLYASLILGLNPHLAAPYSSHALVTATVGMVYQACFFHAFSSRSISTQEQLLESRRRLRHLSMHDALTNLLNLRAFSHSCEQWMAISSRARSPLSMLFIDLDHFKEVNDRHGHEAGDRVLRAVAACLREGARASDLAGRIGGEEFAMLLPDTDLAGAVHLGEKLRADLEALEIPAGNLQLKITASIGAATREARHHAFREIQEEADQAMYQAKQGGRNRVSTLSTPVGPGA